MNALRIRLFGEICVEQDRQPVSDLPAKALELLCYLFLYRDRAHTREELATLLWPDASYTHSKKYLRQILWRLQTALGAEPNSGRGENPTWLILNPGWVRINPQSAWWLDVDAFERAHVLCRDTPGQVLTEQQAQLLEEAMALYQGDLMELWYQDWCIYERDRLQLTYLAMLEQLMGYCETQRSYTKGVAYGQGILRYDQARECTHQHLMRLYYRAGDRTGALRQYDRCAAALAKEFNLQPSHETVALYEQIRADQLDETAAQPMETSRQPDDRSGTNLLLEIHKQLDQIQFGLSSFQQQVQHELAALKAR
jgi:DNA-binding SARP family transcriptional activator